MDDLYGTVTVSLESVGSTGYRFSDDYGNYFFVAESSGALYNLMLLANGSFSNATQIVIKDSTTANGLGLSGHSIYIGNNSKGSKTITIGGNSITAASNQSIQVMISSDGHTMSLSNQSASNVSQATSGTTTTITNTTTNTISEADVSAGTLDASGSNANNTIEVLNHSGGTTKPGSSTIGTINLSGGDLNIKNATLTGTANVSRGVLYGSDNNTNGTINVTGGTYSNGAGTVATANVSAGLINITNGSITNVNASGSGRVEVNGTGVTVGTLTDSGTGAVTVYNGKVTTLKDTVASGAASIDIRSGNTVTNFVDSSTSTTAGSLTNAGTITNFTKDGTAALNVTGTGSIGTLAQSAGTLSLKNTVTGTTTISGGTTDFTTSTLGSKVTVSGGTVNLDQATLNSTLEVSGGSVTGSTQNTAGTITVDGGTYTNGTGTASQVDVTSGTVNAAAGTITTLDASGTGAVNVNGGMVNNLTVADNSTATVSSGTVNTLSNASTTTVTGGTVSNMENIGTVNINGGTVTNLTNDSTANVNGGTVGTLTNTAGHAATVSSGTVNTLANAGTATVTGGTVDALNNTGDTIVNDGTVGSLTNSGTTTIHGGTVTGSAAGSTGAINVAGGTYTNGTGTAALVNVASGTVNAAAGTITTLHVGGSGTANVNGATVNTFTNAGTATISGGSVDALTNTGTANITGGTVTGSSEASTGTINVAGGSYTGGSGAINAIHQMGGTTSLGTGAVTTATIDGGTLNTAGSTISMATMNGSSNLVNTGTLAVDLLTLNTTGSFDNSNSTISAGLIDLETEPGTLVATGTINADTLVIGSSITDGTLARAISGANADDIRATVNDSSLADKEIAAASGKSLILDTANDKFKFSGYRDGTEDKSVLSDSGLTDAVNDIYTEMYGPSLTDPFTNKAAGAEFMSAVSSLGDAEAVTLLNGRNEQAGRLITTPSLAGTQAMNTATTIMTQNVVQRLSEITTPLPSDADVKGAADAPSNNAWFKMRYTNVDVKAKNYDTSKVETTNYQLGYDSKIGENAYFGGYIGTTSGYVANCAYKTVIDKSFQAGLYGTWSLGQGAFINYIARYGTLTNKFAGKSWDTKDYGLMLEYGRKIQKRKDLFITPYVQVDYDHIKTDSVTYASGNVVKVDDTNNLDLKLGLNIEQVDDKGGSVYGGIAYGRGLSGSYDAYMNSLALPNSVNRLNVVYLNFGIKTMMSDASYVDFNIEKTLGDYDGWSLQSKFNLMF